MTRLVLMRHGPTEWTQQRRLQGRRDIILSDEGRALLQDWAVPEGAHKAVWYTSPLARAVETAQLLGAQDAIVEPRLIEMDWGAWEGHNLPDLRERLGEDMRENEACGFDFRPEGGESPRELLARLQSWLVDVGRNDRPAIAITHKGVIRTLMAAATGWDLTGKPPAKIKWGMQHHFDVASDGTILLVLDGEAQARSLEKFSGRSL